jgi:hypothetical protein
MLTSKEHIVYAVLCNSWNTKLNLNGIKIPSLKIRVMFKSTVIVDIK